MAAVRLRRVYDAPESADGLRILVDRLWPRGLSRVHARLDEWLREVAPSDELRRWFGHLPERYPEFRHRYQAELAQPDRAQALAHLVGLAQTADLTLLTATRVPERSHAAVLAQLLAEARTGEEAGEGGDPACWLGLTCPDCGSILEGPRPPLCPRCGAGLTA